MPRGVNGKQEKNSENQICMIHRNDPEQAEKL